MPVLAPLTLPKRDSRSAKLARDLVTSLRFPRLNPEVPRLLVISHSQTIMIVCLGQLFIHLPSFAQETNIILPAQPCDSLLINMLATPPR
jgi:hypothetical protein